MKNEYMMIIGILILFMLLNKSTYDSSNVIGVSEGKFTIDNCTSQTCTNEFVPCKALLAFGSAGENIIYKYSPYTNRWTQLTNTPTDLPNAAYAIANYFSADTAYSSIYDASTETWSDTFFSPKPEDFDNRHCFSIGNTIVDVSKPAAATYQPATKKWIITPLKNPVKFQYKDSVFSPFHLVINDNIYMMPDGEYAIYDKDTKTFSDVYNGPSIDGYARYRNDPYAQWTCAMNNIAILGYGIVTKYNAVNNTWSTPIQVSELYLLDDDQWTHTVGNTIISLAGKVAIYNPENDTWTRQNSIPLVPGTTHMISCIMSF